MSPDPIIPTTIISGFLGAGKTTLLSRIMRADTGLRIAVMVNDFGQINIDSQLVVNNDGKVMNLANGCICCTISDDLVGQLDSLLRQEETPDYILIEASGVSDPGRIARTLNYPAFRGRIKLDAILTLLDAGQLPDLEDEFRQLAMTQLEAADIVIINKTDQCSAADLEAIKAQWLFPDSRCYETVHADVPLTLILATGTHVPAADPAGDWHDHGELFENLSWQCTQPLKLAALRAIIEDLPLEIYRAKGIFLTEEMPETPVVLQQVGSRVEWTRGERDALPAKSALLLIGRRGGFDGDAILARLNTLCVI